MKRGWLLIMVVGAMGIPAVAKAQMVMVVRHAERADGGATPGNSMTTSPDPALSDAGRARAQKLAAMLADAGVTAIYTTEYLRTRDTAAPLAAKIGVTAEVVMARDADTLIAKVKSHKTGAVLVVGHSNTVPAIIRALGGSVVSVGDDEYDSLFFVAANGTTTRIRFRP